MKEMKFPRRETFIFLSCRSDRCTWLYLILRAKYAIMVYHPFQWRENFIV